MKKNKIYFWSTLVVLVITIIILATGSSILNLSLDNENTIPFGTFITRAGLIALPLFVFWSIKELREPSGRLYKILSILIKAILVLGILWAPICYLLAGNIAFNFSEKETFQGGQDAMRWFWRFTYAISVGVILTVLLYWFSLFLKKIMKP